MRGVLIVVMSAMVTGLFGCPSSDVGNPGGVLASATLDRVGGELTHGPLTLVVPEGALHGPTTLTLREVVQPPRGAVGPAIMVADRELHGTVMQHQGPFFRIGFEGHGVDPRLGSFCESGPGRFPCHAGMR